MRAGCQCQPDQQQFDIFQQHLHGRNCHHRQQRGNHVPRFELSWKRRHHQQRRRQSDLVCRYEHCGKREYHDPAGALTRFTRNGTGGSAQFLTNAGGRVDFSGTTGAAGNNQVTAGSIAPISSFKVGGAKPAADLGVVTAAAEIQMMSGWALMGKFDGEFGVGTQTYVGTARARYAW